MKKFLLVLIGLFVVVGGIVFLKGAQIASLLGFVAEMEEAGMPPVPVSSVLVEEEEWEEVLEFPGSLRAVEGVLLTAEIGGVISKIAVENGAEVEKGQLLLEFDVVTERAELAAAEARMRLAQVNLDRAKDLLSRRTIAQSEFDTASANLDEAFARVENLRSLIDKKIIRAPFEGTVGIREVNLGQTVTAGDPLIPIFNDNPIFVEFSVPQSKIPMVRVGQTVRVSAPMDNIDPLEGVITAVNPSLNETTRSVRVQGTLKNEDGVLRPGEFVRAMVILPEKKKVLRVPTTAVLTAAFGNSVFVIREENGNLVAKQQFVQTGAIKGDFIEVIDGVDLGDRVVSAGAFKLSNGMSVAPNDSMQPEASTTPSPETP